MFIESAKATADQGTDEQLKKGLLFPPQSKILKTEVSTVLQTATSIFNCDLERVDQPEDINYWLRAMLYKPQYS
jgi:malate dehydrogenase (oxaloacetate-decarboxylating)(NADP+)